MNGLGKQFFSGSGFPADQDRGIVVGKAAGIFLGFLDKAGFSDDIGEMITGNMARIFRLRLSGARGCLVCVSFAEMKDCFIAVRIEEGADGISLFFDQDGLP